MAIDQFSRIGIVGAGNMGAMMALGLAEKGLDISIWDVKTQNVDAAQEMARQTLTLRGKVDAFHDVKDFMNSLSGERTKLFVFSITHGSPADSVLEKIWDELNEGDIILDGGNEHYRTTERRQRKCAEKGVRWVGMGVSGGYQSARHGPSLSPGGDKDAVSAALPVLEAFAAREPLSGKPCVTYIGPGGSGHYVKMVHNGIEHGMLSLVCEAWGLLRKSLGLSNAEIGTILAAWNASGELRDCFLLEIGAEICQRQKTPEGDQNGEGKGDFGYVLDDVLDKVVQDDDGTEGTGYWTVAETALRHVAAPAVAAGHALRIASGNRAQRVKVADKLKPPGRTETLRKKDTFIEDLRLAVYAGFLASFTQGLQLIARASRDEEWDVSIADCLQIWRAGCIIRAGHIADLLQPVFVSSTAPIFNSKLIDEVARDIRETYAPLKTVVTKGVEWDAVIPALSASLEYVKYAGNTELPTQFQEAQMDFFGAHGYDRVGVNGEDPGKTRKGAHHYEWRPA
ncbi:6-phosphogluconate dehydrogenase C-terminal domain-like protein [Schizophyllum commune H4-8]|uniref:6-phosphogluconate dehydrogenase, decarboxylating n=1 Tax=Schizophyllum commune (strain H4-8 / FGSC 9210) TaxID=578458 RepID=D8PV26_SCHCM|nr:6-phosphogluconate dehydrogenase C-terminal domain-like protein [Schizophyllum commune H4-8]KAI5900518.1 6-phosphogluconate dehydrogenase C-terminal domain-like protein [Schizophyllum commune H4-8]